MKKALSLFLAAVMVVGMIPLSAISIFAETTEVTLSDDAASATYTDLNEAIAAVADGGTIKIVGTYTYVNGYTWEDHDKTVTITGDGTGIIEAPKGNMNIHDSVTFTALTLNNHGGNIYANGNPLTINADVNIPDKVNIISGGNDTGKEINGNTSLTLYAGSYTFIMGGSYGGKVNGNTHVTIGGNVNLLYTTIDGNRDVANVYGGGYGKGDSPVEVTGNSSVTVTGNARANNVIGGVMTPGTVHGDSYVTMDGGDVYHIIGGGRGANANNTFVNVTGGNVRYIFGGSMNAAVTGDTNVYVGGTTNKTASDILGECVVSDHKHQDFRIFGGGYSQNSGYTNSVTGNTYVTVAGEVKANGVYGGGDAYSTGIGGTAYVNILGGNFMTVYGGGYTSPVANTVVTFAGGTAEQVFGGSESAAVTGNTIVRALGGTITRRLYGGSYNEYDEYDSEWKSEFGVAGTSAVVISDKATIDFSYSGGLITADKSIYAGSRHANNVDGNEILAFLDAAAKTKYSAKLGAQDLIMQGYMNGKAVADEIHTLSHTVNGSVITETCTEANCEHNATASLVIDGSCGYNFGEPVTPAKIVYSANWLGEELGAITYENNTAMVGETATAKATLTRTGATATLDFEIVSNRIEVYNEAKGEDTAAFKDLLGTKLLEHTTYVLMEDIYLGEAKLAPSQIITLANGTTIDGQGNSITGFDLTVGRASALFDATDKVGTDEGKAMVMTIKDVVFGSESDPVEFPHGGGANNGYIGFAIIEEVGANDTLTLSGLTSYVESTGTGTAWQYYSAILGKNNGKVSIDNCKTYGTLGAHGYNGGFIGQNSSTQKVEITSSENHVDMTPNNTAYYGGFIGETVANSNVTIDNCKNIGDINGVRFVGGFIGSANGTVTIKNCINEGKITGAKNSNVGIGGIIGNIEGGTIKIESCTNAGDVVGTTTDDQCGGIVGFMKAVAAGSYIRDCVNTGNIGENGSTVAIYCGGIVATAANISISGCTNNGAVKARNIAAGIAATASTDITVTGCSNIGTIETTTGTAWYHGAGGILGYTNGVAVTIQNCVNEEAINGIANAGGAIGSFNASKALTISKFVNKSTVTGTIVGGVIGNIQSTTLAKLSDTKSSGTITGTSNVGGLIGNQASGPVEIYTSSNLGAVNGENAGGFVGNYYSGTIKIESSQNQAAITGAKAGGFIGYAQKDSVTIRKSINSGSVTINTKDNGIGGFIGVSSCGSITIEESMNSGYINANNSGLSGTHAGGAIGKVTATSGTITISDFFNKGTIKSTSSSGGAIGVSQDGDNVGLTIDVDRLINTGDVYGQWRGCAVTGYVKSAQVQIDDCISTGKVTQSSGTSWAFTETTKGTGGTTTGSGNYAMYGKSVGLDTAGNFEKVDQKISDILTVVNTKDKYKFGPFTTNANGDNIAFKEPEFKGHQVGKTVTEDGKVKVRFVAAIDDVKLSGDGREYTFLGFRLTIDGEAVYKEVEYVYKAIKANEGEQSVTYSAEALGGKYIYAVVAELDASTAHSIVVETFTSKFVATDENPTLDETDLSFGTAYIVNIPAVAAEAN